MIFKFNLSDNLITKIMGLLGMLQLSACGGSSSNSSDISDEMFKLQQAQAKWASHDVEYYTFNYQHSCFCVPEATQPMSVSVINSVILSAVITSTNQPVSIQIRDNIHSVERAFELIQSAINQNADDIQVNYHDDLGYPQSIDIDYDFAIADDELTLSLSQLEVKDKMNALDDVNWHLTDFITIQGPQPIIDGTNVTLLFNFESSTLGGVGGCNIFGGDYTLDAANSHINITGMVATEIWCDQPEGVSEQEQQYFSALEDVSEYIFYNATLQLFIGADNVLQFERP